MQLESLIRPSLRHVAYCRKHQCLPEISRDYPGRSSPSCRCLGTASDSVEYGDFRKSPSSRSVLFDWIAGLGFSAVNRYFGQCWSWSLGQLNCKQPEPKHGCSWVAASSSSCSVSSPCVAAYLCWSSFAINLSMRWHHFELLEVNCAAGYSSFRYNAMI